MKFQFHKNLPNYQVFKSICPCRDQLLKWTIIFVLKEEIQKQKQENKILRGKLSTQQTEKENNDAHQNNVTEIKEK
jgi:hypothetical protein